MSARAAARGLGVLLAVGSGALSSPAGPGGPLRPVGASELFVESGRVALASPPMTFSVRTPGMRAVVRNTSGTSVEVAFTYRGPTTTLVALGSGEMRHQIGLKLKAEDTCNLVYVTWQIAPGTGIHVSVKRNPGQHLHTECADRGYTTLTPRWSRAVEPIQRDVPHRLAAWIDGDILRVAVDGALAWEQALPAAAAALDGPVGVRSDNVQLDFAIKAAPGAAAVRDGGAVDRAEYSGSR